MRHLKTGLIALFVLAFAAAAFAQDNTYTIDGAHSSATFSIRHMGISTVPGRFSQISGTIVYDEKDVTKSSVQATIKTATVNTDNEYRDKDLKSANYFDVEKFPEITFQSKAVEKSGNGFVAHGTLTIHGVAKDVDLPFEMKGPVEAGQNRGKVMGAHASLTINRQDFGVGKPTPMIGSDVRLELFVEARMAPPAPPAGK